MEEALEMGLWAKMGWFQRYWPGTLWQRGVLGMNRRNADYLLTYNPRSRYPLVDDKLQTKRVCEAAGIPVPKNYAVVSQPHQIRTLPAQLAAYEQFVLKPARGAEGRGIIVVAQNGPEFLQTPRQEALDWVDFCHHTANILSGLYSLSGLPDVAMVEERILPHPAFEKLAVDGTPDLRILLYRQIPIMAMLRLPTQASRGKANLHQGAVGVGVDLQIGRTLGGVCRNRTVHHHPDTQLPLNGHAVPYWEEVLWAAMRLADQLQLGYLGVDFVLSALVGPVVLEANARPGLAIQLANRYGLLKRLQWVENHLSSHTNPPSIEERLVWMEAIAFLK